MGNVGSFILGNWEIIVCVIFAVGLAIYAIKERKFQELTIGIIIVGCLAAFVVYDQYFSSKELSDSEKAAYVDGYKAALKSVQENAQDMDIDNFSKLIKDYDAEKAKYPNDPDNIAADNLWYGLNDSFENNIKFVIEEAGFDCKYDE